MPELNIILQNGVMTAAQQTTMNLQELVINMKASGMGSDAIRNVLLNDLNTGGAIFGNFKNSVKKTVAGGVGMAGNGAAFQKYTKAGVKTFRWITAGAKSCPDCIPRHGETGSMEYFETIGVPKSGFSVCGANCQCTLVPEGYNGENLEKPLVREKKVSVTDPKMAGKHKTVGDARRWAEKNISHKIDLRGVDNLEALNEINQTMSKLNNKYGVDKINQIILSTGADLNAGGMANYQIFKINRQVFDDLNFMKGRKYDKIYHSRFGVADSYNDIKRLRALIIHEHGHIVADQLFGQINGADLLKKYSFGMSKSKAISEIIKNPKILDNIIKDPIERKVVINYATKKELRNEWKQIWGRASKDLDFHKKASEYGMFIKEELFAEAYCMREMGEKLPDYIESFFRKLEL